MAEFKLGRREFNRKLRLLRLQSSHVSLKLRLQATECRRKKKNFKHPLNAKTSIGVRMRMRPVTSVLDLRIVQTDTGVVLTLVLTDIYITLMI